MKTFLFDRSGNFGITAALLATPLILAAGGVIDYAGGLRAKNSAQNAADTAVLAGTRQAGDLASKKAKAKAHFESNISDNLDVVSHAFNDLGNGSYEYVVQLQHKPHFLPLIGINQIDMNVRSQALDAKTNLDIVFVLDASGSMGTSDGATTRMAELKKAVKLFLGSFQTGSTVQAALVPFDTQVRVDNATMVSNTATANTSNPYGATTDCSTIADPIDRKSCEDNKPVYYADCTKLSTAHRVDDAFDREMCGRKVAGFRFDSTGAYAESSFDSYQYIATTSGGRHRIVRNEGDKCTTVHNTSTAECVGFVYKKTEGYIYDQPAPAPTGPAPSTSKTNTDTTATNNLLVQGSETWSGCVIDRSQSYDVSSAPPVSSQPLTQYPRSHCAQSSLLAVKPLTNNLSGLSTYVDGMKPNGNTNLTIGVQWGMEAMTPSFPLTGARTDPSTRKIMILLTDGENTQNRWWGWDRRADIDGRARLACDNAKAMSMEIYAVRLIGGNETLLKHCAEDAQHYYGVNTASELSDVFESIAIDLRRIRLTH
ncbi:TadE/TadG family type IV pilus assembly protein [Fulvimarina sp. MAC3]|uniref:vWA domain-containing protein n=1 Tax=Fulvimarina sp. MAC3 TaxID=3148887 RepID=UPI0031FC0DF3